MQGSGVSCLRMLLNGSVLTAVHCYNRSHVKAVGYIAKRLKSRVHNVGSFGSISVFSHWSSEIEQGLVGGYKRLAVQAGIM